MMSNVPQFIDVEDKIAGPLTWRQLLWMIGMGAVVLLVFAFLDGPLVFVVSVPVVLLFVALAFYRPNGQPLVQFIFSAISFLFQPKVMMWDRPTGGASYRPVARKAEPKENRSSRPVSAEDIRRVAEMVDRR